MSSIYAVESQQFAGMELERFSEQDLVVVNPELSQGKFPLTSLTAENHY